MFQKLQDKWKVNAKDLLLILITFAVGGSACGIAGKKIMSFLEIDKGLTWLIVYIIILTIIWPLCVLLISIPMGQFTFFKKYLGKIFSRMSGKRRYVIEKIGEKQPIVKSQESKVHIPQSLSYTQGSAVNSKHSTFNTKMSAGNPDIVNLAIFASGAGSNAQQIIEHFRNNPDVKIALVVCNKPGAGVLTIAQQNGIDTLIIERQQFYSGDAYVKELNKYGIQWIILAGFLWKLPDVLIHNWPNRIINIHPALLPKYGGKGMYGRHVHEAVINSGDKESGISIHYVDEIYDHGEVIMRARCEILETDTPETLAEKIHSLEHTHFPKVIETEILKAKT